MLGKFVEQAEKDDPERLRERIAALEGELKAARKTPVAAPAPKIDKAAILRNAKQIQEAVEKMHADIARISSSFNKAELPGLVAQIEKLLSGEDPVKSKVVFETTTVIKKEKDGWGIKGLPEIASTPKTNAQDRILRAIADCEATMSKSGLKPSKKMVAAAAGYSHKSSGFDKVLAGLKGQGQINYPSPGTLSITAAGLAGFRIASGRELSRAELLNRLRNQLSGVEIKVFEFVAENPHDEYAKDYVAKATGYSDKSSGFDKTLSKLRGMDLIDYSRPGFIKACDWFAALD